MAAIRNDSTTHSVIHLKASSPCAWITKWFWLWLCCYGYGVLVPHCSSAQHWWTPHQPQFVCLHWGRPGNDPWSAEAAAWLSVEARANRGHVSVKARIAKYLKSKQTLSNRFWITYSGHWANRAAQTSFSPEAPPWGILSTPRPVGRCNPCSVT